MSRPDHDPSIDEAAAAWCVRLLGAPSDEDLTAFDRWLAADPTHAEAWRRAQAAWTLFDEQAVAPELLAMRRDALSRAHGAGARRWGRAPLGRRTVAAALALLVVPAAATAWLFQRSTAVAREFRTGVGERRTVTLEDGSVLTLDAGAWVRTAFTRDLRPVELLAGRVHFEVAKDPLRPLKVHAGPKTITAIGTAFTVERRDSRVVVTLVEGRVAVTDDASRATEVEMKPSQQLVLAPNRPAVMRNDVDLARAMAWREGKLIFEDESLADAAERMNAYSHLHLSIEGDSARRLRISGVFNAGDTPAFVEAVKAYFPVSTETSGQEITIRPKG